MERSDLLIELYRLHQAIIIPRPGDPDRSRMIQIRLDLYRLYKLVKDETIRG